MSKPPFPTLIADAIRRPDEPAHFMVLKSLSHRASARVGGRTIADDPAPVRVQEAGRDLYDPVVYFERAAVDMTCLEPTDKTTHCPLKGSTEYFDVTVDGTRYPNAAWSYVSVLDFDPRLARLVGRIAFDPRVAEVVEHTTEAAVP